MGSRMDKSDTPSSQPSQLSERHKLCNAWSAFVKRINTRLSNQEIAERIGCDRSNVAKWKNGHNVPSALARRALIDLSMSLGLS
jgi:DNA-binding transcriptional regulator YiaG